MKYQLPFGTYGIRGNAQTHPFVAKHLKALGHAIELWMQHKGWPLNILIGADTRASSPRIKNELSAGFSQEAHIFDAGVIPTPGILALLKKHDHFGCGIVITASHNPALDNGIKIFLRHGAELQTVDQHAIQGFFNTCFNQPQHAPLLNAQRIPYATAASEYLAKLKKHFAPRFLSGLSIGIDCANGATSSYAPEIFEFFGARVVSINTTPDGHNINKNCGSNAPEALKALVLSNNLSCGFAFDGDGDRVVAVNRQGILKNGDDLLFIIASNPTRKRQGPVVGTTMSNSSLSKAFASLDRTFTQAGVGEIEVIKTMEAHGSNLGGEPSGHIIAREYLMGSDGLFAALATLDAAFITNNANLASFEHQPQALKNIVVPKKIPLNTPELEAILHKYQALIKDCLLLVRYSGTESMLRILLEADTQERATALANSLSLELATAINTLAHEPKADSDHHEQDHAQDGANKSI